MYMYPTTYNGLLLLTTSLIFEMGTYDRLVRVGLAISTHVFLLGITAIVDINIFDNLNIFVLIVEIFAYLAVNSSNPGYIMGK